MSAARPWPTDLNFSRADRMLTIAFDDGATFRLPAEYLRVESPSAEVQGHGSGQKQTVPGKRRVGIARVEPVGRYAVRIVFDDGHDTGLFSWDYLYELGREQTARWADYERRLASLHLSRDP